MDKVLTFLVPIVFGVALLLIYFIPRIIVPRPSSSRREDIVSTVAARNEIRKTAAQLLAGSSFVLTFVLSIYNFNRDFTQKASQARAEQFATAVARVNDKQSDAWTIIGTFQVLSKIGREDSAYHQMIYSMMAPYIVTASQPGCSDTKAVVMISPRIQLIARIFADRNTDSDDPYRKFSLEAACLSGVNWLDAEGLANLYMPRVRIVNADLRNTTMNGTVMDRAVGGLDQLKDWWPVKAHSFSAAEEIESWQNDNNTYYWTNFWRSRLHNVSARSSNFLGANFSDAEMQDSNWQSSDLRFANFARAKMTSIDLSNTLLDNANFRDADLTNGHLAGAHLDGANMQNAVLKGTNLRKTALASARNLTAAQLRSACVWPDAFESLADAQPEFPESVRGLTLPQCQEPAADSVVTRLINFLTH